MASTSRKRLSSNSPSPRPAKSARTDIDPSAATQSLGVQLEAILNDPLAQYNDEINTKIIAQCHDILDPELIADYPIQIIFGVIIEVVSNYMESSIDESYLKQPKRILLVEKYHELPSMLSNAWKNKDFKQIRTLQILQKLKSDIDSITGTNESNNQAFVNATESSWVRDFKGTADKALWHHITHYYKMDWYANYVAIVQSSGMGKSRTIDELSKTRLTIPLCLRSGGSTGYPYADSEVRHFLTSPKNEQDAHLHALAFLCALFEQTKMVLESHHRAKPDENYSDVANSFRKYMSVNRQKFYPAVVNQARRYSSNMYSKPDSSVGSLHVEAAFEKLQDVITPLRTKESLPFHDEPILLIAWDEAHTLSEKIDTCSSWSHLVALRQVLHGLIDYPIFSMFSSTTCEMSHFSPATGAIDNSARVYNREYNPIPPFSDFGFDILLDPENKVSLDAGRSLDEFITDEYMCHLGRPLFGSHYDHGSSDVREELLEFAAMKLVRDKITPKLSLSPIQKIACLSFRLPIQFNSTVYASRKHDKVLVEDHMRICLKVDSSNEFMNTHSSSEPFLSEAAYYLTNRNSLEEGRRLAVEAFRELTEGFAIHTGDRGEFLALLLCTLARDATVGMPAAAGHARSRSFGLAEFLCDNLIRNKLASEESQRNLESLRSDFPNTCLHFNHFIKAHEESVITQENILLLMARGAAFLCANCQPEVDFILPFLKDGTKMTMENSGFILAQVKNDKRYGASVDKEIFKRMNPYKLGILKNNAAPPPIIRIVFALGSAKASVHVIRHKPSKRYDNVIYDIWIAGITPDVLRPIDPVLEDSWKVILQASYGWKDLFDTIDTDAEKVRRSMDVASCREDAHWIRWSRWTQENAVD